jgi:drug/metabolite transporter (DMT)-like permease
MKLLSIETETIKPIVPAQNTRLARISVVLAIGATIIWGSQYILMKQGVETIPVFLYQGIRNLIAFIGFLPLFSRFRKTNWETIKASLILSVVFVFLLAFITYGLKYTTSSKGAFFASSYIIFTPFIGYILLKSKILKIQLLAVGIAIIGMAIMAFGNGNVSNSEMTFNIGDILTLIAAIFNAIQIVLFEKYVKSINIVLFCIYQMLFIGILMISISFIIGEHYDFATTSLVTWGSWIYLGIVAGTITLLIQAFVQQYIESTRAALLFSMEPVFAMFFSYYLGNETFTYAFIIGAALIMTGIIIVSIRQKA